MKWILMVLVVAMMSGCATKVEYVDRSVEVKVPVKCELEMPKKPGVTIDVDGLKAVLVYTELL